MTKQICTSSDVSKFMPVAELKKNLQDKHIVNIPFGKAEAASSPSAKHRVWQVIYEDNGRSSFL